MRFALLPLALALAVPAAGCVTRTVYVVDDSPPSELPPTAAAPAAAPPAAAPPVDVAPAGTGIASVDDFYEPLAPYGRWLDYPGYGRVWVPSASVVGAGFRPYTNGHWEYTEWGWTWVGHSPFSWATGHYGRWFYDASYGWVWVPGTVWSPAWVAWRTGGGYAGWAPLPPGAEYGAAYTVYDTSWVFVPYGSLGVAYVGSAIVVGPAYRTCLVETYPAYDTVVVHGHRYARGPDYDDVERSGGHVIHRPARDIDREHPVTRPPEGVARTRPGSSPSSSGRGRDGSQPATGHTRGTWGSDRGQPDANGPDRGQPDRGQPDRGDARPDRGDARSDTGRDEAPVFTPGRGPERSGPWDTTPGRPLEVTPREDPAAGTVDTQPARPAFGRYDGGRDAPRPITPPPVERPDGLGPVGRPNSGPLPNPDRFRPFTDRPSANPGFPQPAPSYGPQPAPSRGAPPGLGLPMLPSSAQAQPSAKKDADKKDAGKKDAKKAAAPRAAPAKGKRH